MRRSVSLKKGLNLNLEGGLRSETPVAMPLPAMLPLIPDDFPGFVPKLDVAEGDRSRLVHHYCTTKTIRVKLVAPAAGTVEAVVRGARRKIERVVISLIRGCLSDCQAETCAFCRCIVAESVTEA